MIILMHVKRDTVFNPAALYENKHTRQLAVILLHEKHAYLPPPEGPLEGEHLHQQAEHLQAEHQQDAEENLVQMLLLSSQM